MVNRHCLCEHLAVEKAGLMKKPGKDFGPADWQNDCTVEFLQSHWDEATSLLRGIRENPDAFTLFRDTLTHLQRCCEIARQSLTDIGHLTDKKREKFDTILGLAVLQLETMGLQSWFNVRQYAGLINETTPLRSIVLSVMIRKEPQIKVHKQLTGAYQHEI